MYHSIFDTIENIIVNNGNSKDYKYNDSNGTPTNQTISINSSDGQNI